MLPAAMAAAGIRLTDFIQTNAAIHMGSFGGPMFNLEGKIIGINSIHVSYSGINH